MPRKSKAPSHVGAEVGQGRLASSGDASDAGNAPLFRGEATLGATDSSESDAGSGFSASDSDAELLDRQRPGGEVASQRPMPTTPVSDTPDWTTWKKRPAISVRDGVLLAHNIRPDAKVWATVRNAADPRASTVGTACKTASLSMGIDPRLNPINAVVKERQQDRLRQKVDIRKFAAWAVEAIDNQFMSTEFRALMTATPAPSSPAEDSPDAWDRSLEILRAKYPLETATAVTKRLQSVARLLVAVAVDKYGLEVTEAGESFDGTLAALSRTTGDAGFRPMDHDTISDALSFAVDLGKRDVVLTAMGNRAVRRKR